MATQPIEEAVTSAGTNNISVNSAGQNGTVNSANNDIYKNEGVIAAGKLMYGKTNAWHEADDAEKEKLSNQNANIAKQLNDLYGIDLSRGDDGVWRTADGSNFYDVIGLTNSGTANNAGNASGAGNANGGNVSGAVGGTSANSTSGASGTGGTTVAGVVGATTKGGYFNDRGQYVITDKIAYNLISEAKNESQKWYTMSPAERQASHTANKQRMDEVSRLTGRQIIYNEADGTYYWENGEKVYDSLFDLEKSHYPEYQDRSAQITETYDTALANQLTANEEARLWQEQLLRANVDNMEKEYDAMARQSYADTARQLENEKLRQALNGERGGVGERQFGIYQSAGSERLYNIELERQKLRSDTEAQIAQLKAEGRIADAQLIAEFALEKDKALQTEADRVYQAEVNKTAYNDSRDDTAFDQTRILNSEREEQRNNEFNRNIAQSQIDLSWANFNQAKDEHKDAVMFNWIDTYFKAQQFEQDSRQRVFTNALALIQYDGGKTLEETFGIKVRDPNVLEYYKYAVQAALKVFDEKGDRSLMNTVLGDMYDCIVGGGSAVITDEGKLNGFFKMPDGSMYNFSEFGKYFDIGSIEVKTNTDGGIDIDEEYTQGGNNDTSGNTGGNTGGNENGNGGNEDTSQNTSQNTSDDGGIDLPRDDGGIDIDKATETNEKFVNTNRDGKPETSNLDIMQGINTLKGKESSYNMRDPRQVEEYIKSNENLINSLNVTYKLGITFDYGKKAYVYPDGTRVTDTVLTSVQNTVDDTTPKNIWKQDGGDSKSTTNPNRVGGVSAVKSGQYNSGKFDNYKLGVDADSSGVAKNVPDSAEYLKDGVGNIVTTRSVDSEYLKKNPGTFAVDNGNGTYSYISIKMPDFTIEKTSKGGGFGYKKIGLDGTVLGTPSKDDLKVWFTWDASVGNPDKYAVGSFEREMALKAMYPNYGAETESSSGGSGVNSTGGYTYKGGGNGSGNGSGNGGYNGYTPPETPPEKTTDNQWLMSVVQGTKTFDEWLNDEGKRFKYSGDDEQNRAYWAYVSSKAKEGGLDEDETYIFRKQVESKNS